MINELDFSDISTVESELLTVFAVDRCTSKDKEAKAEPKLLTENQAAVDAARPALTSGDFKAGSNETLVLHEPAHLRAKRLLIVGLGREVKADMHVLRKASGTAVRVAKSRSVRRLAIAVPTGLPIDLRQSLRAIAEGAHAADFDPDVYCTTRKDRTVEVLILLAAAEEGNAGKFMNGLNEGRILGESLNLARKLVNEPGNRMTPTMLATAAAEMCSETAIACTVCDSAQIQAMGMGALWGVGQGSQEPPALIVMRYSPQGAAEDPTLGLIGKGITFDTGGISIKPSSNMADMKGDMAGGAAVIAAMRSIAMLKLGVRVIGIVPAAENMPSSKAQRPGDVQVSLSGKTIEVLDTDAEGRLVLADAITYAKQLGATHLLDAATLTGSCVATFGSINGGVFSNDEAAYTAFTKSLELSGERFCRLPLQEEYRELLKSSIADIANIGSGAGAITAAMFLKEFVEETPWIHLDIAGVAWTKESKPWMASGANGCPMRTMVEWVRGYASG